jgi:hypothetical protein
VLQNETCALLNSGSLIRVVGLKGSDSRSTSTLPVFGVSGPIFENAIWDQSAGRLDFIVGASKAVPMNTEISMSVTLINIPSKLTARCKVHYILKTQIS